MNKITVTYDYESDLSNIDDSVYDEIAKIIREEIDWEILSEMLVKSGWIRVILPDIRDTEKVKTWAKKSLKENYKHRGNHWVLAAEKDAILLNLTWG